MDPEKFKELAKEALGEELATKMYAEMGESYVGPTSFSQLLEHKKSGEIADQVYDLSNMFRMLAYNICYNSMVEDKVAALETLTSEYLTLVRSATTQTKSSNLLDLIKEKWNGLVGKSKQPDSDTLNLKDAAGSSFMVYKDHTGTMRWAAVQPNHSQAYEGEIIASFAHKEFEQAVEAGHWPYPELWVWHASEKSAVGKADMLHYDEDTGFMFSTGYFYKNKEHVAKGLAAYPEPLRVSHGMPKDHLIYEGGLTYQQAMKSKAHPKCIVHYRDREISPLPFGEEANKLTDFAILTGGN